MEEIRDYVVLGIETTRLAKGKDYINEIVAIKYQDNEIVASKHHVFEYKNIEEISNIYQKFIKNNPVIVHNYSFIRSFLPFEIKSEIIDTMNLSKKIYPSLKNPCVHTIAKHLGYGISKDTDLYHYTLLIHYIFTSIKNELLDRKIKTFILNNKGRANVAIIQRKFLIGYWRAKRLITETLLENSILS